jgi:hypothetical protein
VACPSREGGTCPLYEQAIRAAYIRDAEWAAKSQSTSLSQEGTHLDGDGAWYTHVDEETTGPLSFAELIDSIIKGK